MSLMKKQKKLFDKLAQASGYVWYVNDDKEIYFVVQPTLTEGPYDIEQETPGS